MSHLNLVLEKRFLLNSESSVDSSVSKLSRDEDFLEDRIRVRHLEKLKAYFREHGNENGLPAENGMTETEFQKAVCTCMNSNGFADSAKSWFTRISKNSDNSLKITWKDILSYLNERLLEGAPSQKILSEVTEWRHFDTRKPRNLIAILSIPSPVFVYILIGQDGEVGVYDPHFSHQRSYLIDKQRRSREKKRWIRIREKFTDCLLMENCSFYVTSSTKCSLHFVDVSATLHLESYIVTGLPNIPTCLYYWYNIEDPESDSYLFWGDLTGDIHLLKFFDPSTSLFELGQTDQTQLIPLGEIRNHRRHVQYRQLQKLHHQFVRQIYYIHSTDRLLTCSSEPERSVVSQNVSIQAPIYVIKLQKGVQCFDYSEKNFLLATGSKDALVRLWNPYVFNIPENILKGHEAPVVCIRFHPSEDLLLSLSRNAHLFIWDINELASIQDVRLDIQIPEKPLFITKNSLQFFTWEQETLLFFCNQKILEIPYLQSFMEQKNENHRSDKTENQEFRSDTEPFKRHIMSSYYESQQKQSSWMRFCVRMCCPYLALDLPELVEPTISSDLPTTDRMKRLKFSHGSVKEMIQCGEYIFKIKPND